MEKMLQSERFEASQSEEGRYRLLVEAIHDYAIYMLDPQGRVSSWNPGAQRFKGYLAEEIVGEHFSRFYTEEDREAGIPLRVLATAAERGHFETEGWRVRKDGSRFWAHVIVDPIRGPDGDLVGFAKVTRDITQRHETELQLEAARHALVQAQKMEAVGQLTGGVAHDFNNLLAAILGSLEIVAKRLPDEPRVTPLVQNAIQAAKRGAALTQRMLAFARKQELAIKPTPVKHLVEDVLAFADRSIGPQYGVDVRVPVDLPAAMTDANQLENALLNLIVNARDAMPEGGPIRITARHEDILEGHPTLAPGPYVALSVADSGSGMDETTLARAAEPFFTTKGVGKGTGLGLSMVHGLAAQSGGELRLQSKLGQGTIVEIWSPAAAERTPSEDGETAPSSEAPKDHLVILAVDDDPLVLMNTVAMLEDLGHRVIEANSGTEALAKLQDHPDIQLVLTDQAMPAMTGLELVQRIRKGRQDLSAIIATGYAELPGDPPAGVGLLHKPFMQDELQAALDVASGKVNELR